MALYRGWDLDAMKDTGENAALQVDAYMPPSNFTPINRPGGQLLTPQLSAPSPLTDQTHMVNSPKQRGKHHNPVIAQYLGLGVVKEPSHLERYAPVLPPTPTTPPKSRKRTRKVRDGSSPSKAKSTKSKTLRPRHVSDGFRVTKAVSRRSARKTEHVTSSDALTSSPNGTKIGVDPPRGVEVGPIKLSRSMNSPTLTQAFSVHNNASCDAPSSQIAPHEDSVQPFTDNQRHSSIDDEYFDDVFDSIDLDSTIDQLANTQHQGVQSTIGSSGRPGDSSADKTCPAIFTDEDFFSSTPDLTDNFSSPFQPNGVSDDNNLTFPHKEPAGADTIKSSLASTATGPRNKFISPVTQKSEALIRKEATSGHVDRKPIVRPLFPDAVRDRSPIIGLSSSLLLRTCFRIGEAINQACHATKHGNNIMFELYARVRSSERDAVKQHFVFSDLFHDRPPYLKGEYDAAIWKQVELFNYDSGRFLSKAKMCRCIGKIRRDGNKEWAMTVLNIWEATWEDTEWVEGIVNS